MRLYTDHSIPCYTKSVVALGTFDGCHNGHRHVIKRAVALARKLHCPCVVWTYAQHPLTLLSKENAPAMLQSVSDRLCCLQEMQVDAVCLHTFNLKVAQTEPEAFIEQLRSSLGMQAIVLGQSNTFGKYARGTPAFLAQKGLEQGFGVEVVDTIELGGESITSSAIRTHLAAGHMGKAAAMLGRTYALKGKIMAGHKIGRMLHYPTINVDLPKGRLLPAFGVYAGWADIENKSYPCIINLGIKPTIGDGVVTLEAFLLDFQGELYGKNAKIRLHWYMRPETKFDTMEQLRSAIARDEAKARALFFVD